jgi:flavin-dependent dehydrogenase
MYDVIIVGARCAGSSSAMLLARKGYRVLLVDKAAFPSDTLSSHAIHAPGIDRLKRWGLLERVVASSCPPVHSYTLDLGPFALTGQPPPVDGIATAYAPRRTVLDKILVDAAVDAGAELRERFMVEEVCFEDNRAVGIRGRSRTDSITEQGRLVVGADGLHSTVARMVGAAMTVEKPTVACCYYTYWSGVSVGGIELYPRDRRFFVALPTNDNLVCTAMEWPIEEFHAVRADIEGQFVKTFEMAPGLAGRIRAGKRAERFAGTGDLPNFFRKPYGPGWALVGDAGHHKDPNGAFGISDAFRDAELLAQAVDRAFSGSQPLEEALADYERRRDQASMPSFELNFQFATLQPPPPQMQALFGALRRNQADTDRLIGAMTGTVPIPEFFAPSNVQRIVSAAARS